MNRAALRHEPQPGLERKRPGRRVRRELAQRKPRRRVDGSPPHLLAQRREARQTVNIEGRLAVHRLRQFLFRPFEGERADRIAEDFVGLSKKFASRFEAFA